MGFFKNRFIGENIRIAYDIMRSIECYDIFGLLMSIDFEKAFDTISWDFIFKTFFNFGIFSCVSQNGISFLIFYPQRICRQGYSIPPYLFILSAEILGILRKLNELRLTEKNIRYNKTLMIPL